MPRYIACNLLLRYVSPRHRNATLHCLQSSASSCFTAASECHATSLAILCFVMFHRGIGMPRYIACNLLLRHVSPRHRNATLHRLQSYASLCFTAASECVLHRLQSYASSCFTAASECHATSLAILCFVMFHRGIGMPRYIACKPSSQKVIARLKPREFNNSRMLLIRIWIRL